MEALLATLVTRLEFLCSKIIPYYALGMAAMLLCLAFAVLQLGVPFRGSFALLLLFSTLFLGSSLGLGCSSPRPCATSSTPPRPR